MQQTIEELETSNEELQALNEELKSTNEELQATNEELETSNEELQSTNEELITVNEELQVNSSELMALNAELGSVLGNVPLPMIVLDNALQIVRASKAAINLFDILTPMKNPHLSQIKRPDGFPRLVEVCNQALHFGKPVVIDFEANDTTYTLQCAPFSGEAGQLIGTTLVFIESPALQSLTTEINEVLQHAPLHLLRFDTAGTVLRASEITTKALGIAHDDAIGMPIKELLKTSESTELRELIDRKSARATIALRDKDTSQASWIAAQRFNYHEKLSGEDQSVLLGIEVTDTLKQENLARAHENYLDVLRRDAGIGYWHLSLLEDTLEWSEATYDMHGLNRATFKPELASAIELYHPDDRDLVSKSVTDLKETGKDFEFRCRLLHAEGHAVWVEASATSVTDAEGKRIGLVGMIRDVTDKVATKQYSDQLRDVQIELNQGFFSYHVPTGHRFWSDSLYSLFGVDLNKPLRPGIEEMVKLFHASDRQKMIKLFDKTIEAKKRVETKLRLIKPKRANCTVVSQASFDADGEAEFVFGVLTFDWT